MADYAGLYVYDVYDAVQGGDPSIPANPFNLNGSAITYNGTDYSRCTFPFSQGNKIVRYTLTRKADGMTLSGLTKLATYGSYGDSVGIDVNGATPSLRDIGPGSTYREISVTSLTEIAIKLSNYGDPIAFWLPGATLELPLYPLFGANVTSARSEQYQGFIDFAPFLWTQPLGKVRITTDIFTRYSVSNFYVEFQFADDTSTIRSGTASPLEFTFSTPKPVESAKIYYELVGGTQTPPQEFQVDNIETDVVIIAPGYFPQRQWKDWQGVIETLGPTVPGGEPFTDWGSTAPLVFTFSPSLND